MEGNDEEASAALAGALAGHSIAHLRHKVREGRKTPEKARHATCPSLRLEAGPREAVPCSRIDE